MAATWIKPIHVNEACSAAQSVKNCVDYVTNLEKTQDGELVTSYECSVENVVNDFMETREDYRRDFAWRDRGENEILAYHVRQAFKPGEINDDTANKLGHELALELTGGKNSYIVATHIDKKHIHNHIIINAYNQDCERKYVNEIHSYKKLRQLSDRICERHNLSRIEDPKLSQSRHEDYCYDKEKTPKRTELKEMIDEIIEYGNPKDFDDLLNQLQMQGCELKRRGKNYSVKPPTGKRFIRFKTGNKCLPEGYDVESLRNKIAEMYEQETKHEAEIPPINEDNKNEEIRKRQSKEAENIPPKPSEFTAPKMNKNIQMLIDIENSLKAQTSTGYKKWATSFNLQHAAEMLLFLQNNNLTDLQTLSQTAQQAKTEYDKLQPRIEAADKRMKEISTLQKHIGTYNKTKGIYSQYLRSKRNKDFYRKNEKAIKSCEESKAFFDSLPHQNLPTIKELQVEYAQLVTEKNQCTFAKKEMKQHILDLQLARKNVELLLDIEPELEAERNRKRSANDER